MSQAPDDDEERDDAVRALVKRTLSKDRAPPAPDILRGVQRRLRRRSRGKFFADGWSTAQTRLGYLLVAVLTLLVVAVAYYMLGPTELHW